MPWHDLYFTVDVLAKMDTPAIGLALIVGGAAFLCSGLIFLLLPTGRIKVEQSSAPQ
jgi:hypothetical protein